MGITIVHVRSWQAAYRGLIPQEYLDSLAAGERLPQWERILRDAEWPQAGTFVAEDGGKITGFASICPARGEDAGPARAGELAAIYLVPELWGMGVGQQLMAHALAALRAAGYNEALLWVLDTNSRARRFYEAAGWQADGAVKEDSSWGFVLNEVRYQRPLP
jgi:GNAT superfamily N-acetyltransferase